MTFSFKRPILEGATFDRVTGLTSSVVFEGAWHGFGALGSALGTESARFARHTTACIYENDVPTFRCQQGTSRPPRAPPKTCHQAGKITFLIVLCFSVRSRSRKTKPGRIVLFCMFFRLVPHFPLDFHFSPSSEADKFTTGSGWPGLWRCPDTRPRRATRGLCVQGCSTQSCKEDLHLSAPLASPQARQARPHIPLRSHIHSSTIRPGLRALLLAAP